MLTKLFARLNKVLFLLSILCLGGLSHAEGNGSERGGGHSTVPGGSFVYCVDQFDPYRKEAFMCNMDFCDAIDTCASHNMVWDLNPFNTM